MIHQPVPDFFKDKRLIALDIETTGLSKYSTIIELGVVEVVEGVVKTSYTKLFGGGHSSMYLVRKIHHIRDCERIGKKTFAECAENIANYLSDSWIVTHNGNSFDLPMIQSKLKKAGFAIKNFKSIDTLQMIRKFRNVSKTASEEKKEQISGSNTLENLCREFNLQYGGEDGSNSHRGLEDSEACLDLLFFMINNKMVSL